MSKICSKRGRFVLLAFATVIHLLGTYHLLKGTKHHHVPKWYKVAKGAVNMAKHRKRKCGSEPLFDV